MSRDFKPRTCTAYECDHMRPLVKVAGEWCHIGPDGEALAPCSAGAYRVSATYEGDHVVTDFVGGEKRVDSE